MGYSGNQALLFAANLSLPTFQVIAVDANLGCAHCRSRVTQIISKMAGSKKFTIDVCIKQVIVQGEVRFGHKTKTASEDNIGQKKLKNDSLATCVKRFLVQSFAIAGGEKD